MNRRRGVFPGSFNPLTIAHLEVARLALRAHALDDIYLAVSKVALDKPAPPGPSFDERIALLESDVAKHDWLHLLVTDKQLIAEISEGFDAVIMGADKWVQVNDVRYYRDASIRDVAVASLPTVVVAERSGLHISGAQATVLRTPTDLHEISSTAARGGDREIMAPHARDHWHAPPLIRPVEPHEIDAACSIYLTSRRAAIPAVPPSIHPDDDVQRWFREILATSSELFWAEVDDDPVAVLAVSPGWIEQLYVLPEHTGCGVGSALVNHAKTLHDELELWTFQTNPLAHRFYERHGFVAVERTDGDNEEAVPDVRYRWTRM